MRNEPERRPHLAPRRTHALAFAASLLLAALPTPASATPVYTFVNFDVPGTTTTIAAGINDAGQVVGLGYDGSGLPHGFLRDPDGSFSATAQPVPSRDSTVRGINNAGQYVGQTDVGYLYDPASSTFTTLSADPWPGARQNPFGTYYTSPQGINDSGQVVGYYAFPNTANGFLRDPLTGNYMTLTDPDGTITFAIGINDAGTIVGYYGDVSDNIHAFVRDTAGSYSDLIGPDTANGINNAGQIVGAWGSNGYVLDPVTGFTLLSDPAATSDTRANGINNAGQIVGLYNDGTGTHGFIATPEQTAIPEPASLALLATLLPLARRRRR